MREEKSIQQSSYCSFHFCRFYFFCLKSVFYYFL